MKLLVWARCDKMLTALMALSCVLGLLYNFAMLPGFGPDEPRHFNYVRLLVSEHRLPLILPDGSEYAGAHTLHPPLYYALLAPFHWVLRGLPENTELHLLRLGSLALCLASLPLLWALARRALESFGPDAARFGALLVVAQVGLLPIFGMTCGTLTNDSAMLFAVSGFLYLLAVRFPDDETFRSALILGVAFGLGALCKATVLLCDGAALVLYLIAQQKNWRAALFSGRVWARGATVVLVALLICGWWYGRNLHLYGKLTPLATGYSPADLHWLPREGVLTAIMHPNFPPLFGMANWSIFYSMWSQKDWIPEALRPPIYGLLAFYVVLAAVGARRARRLNALDEADTGARIALRCAYGALVINWLACVAIALFVHWGWAEGGRYLLGSLVGLSLFLVRGWSGLVGTHRLRGVFFAWCTAMLSLNALTLFWLLSYLNPKFGPRG